MQEELLEKSFSVMNVSKSTTSLDSGCRKDYIDWDEFFMATALLSAKRSKDPCTQVGACIANSENKIVGTGYNGMPKGCDDKLYPWGKTGPLCKQKFLYVCHAEMNAVMNRNCFELKDCRMYVVLFPCNECAKVIIQSGLREIIYLSDKNVHKEETKAAKMMFDSAGVKYWQYIPTIERLVIDFKLEQRKTSTSVVPDTTSSESTS